MNYIFATIYVLGAILILLNVIQLFTLGWSWPPVIKIFLAILWLLCNYLFMKETYKARNERKDNQPKK